jgi:hypothetical protein
MARAARGPQRALNLLSLLPLPPCQPSASSPGWACSKRTAPFSSCECCCCCSAGTGAGCPHVDCSPAPPALSLSRTARLRPSLVAALRRGLDNAGKTTLLHRLTTGKMSTHEPTKHKDTVEVTMGNAHIKALDLGGHESARKVRRASPWGWLGWGSLGAACLPLGPGAHPHSHANTPSRTHPTPTPPLPAALGRTGRRAFTPAAA